jgi:hypothetical protein
MSCFLIALDFGLWTVFGQTDGSESESGWDNKENMSGQANKTSSQNMDSASTSHKEITDF